MFDLHDLPGGFSGPQRRWVGRNWVPLSWILSEPPNKEKGLMFVQVVCPNSRPRNLTSGVDEVTLWWLGAL